MSDPEDITDERSRAMSSGMSFFGQPPGGIEYVEVDWPSCLRCGEQLTAAVTVGSLAEQAVRDQPVLDALDGGWSICGRCGNVAVYVVDGDAVKLRPLRPAERGEVDADEELQAALEQLARIRKGIE